MTPEALVLALAAHSGEQLTVGVARSIVAALFPRLPIDPAQFPAAQVGRYLLQCEAFEETAELHAVHQAYHAETDTTGEPLAYDYPRMRAIYLQGGLAMFTARVAETGELVGVMRVFVSRNERGVLTARDNMFFIYPAHRGLPLAVRLWRYAERCMFDHGVRKVTFSSMTATGAEKMARFLGYQPTAIQFSKTHQGDDYAALATRHTPKKGNDHDPEL